MGSAGRGVDELRQNMMENVNGLLEGGYRALGFSPGIENGWT